MERHKVQKKEKTRKRVEEVTERKWSEGTFERVVINHRFSNSPQFLQTKDKLLRIQSITLQVKKKMATNCI